MEPKRGMVIKAVDIDGILVAADTYVWILASEAVQFTVEYRNRVATIPREAVVICPVQVPPMEQLRLLDECFDHDDEAFDNVYVDVENYFAIQRCKAHGRRFLRDTRGGSAMYERLTLLHAEDDQNPRAVWSRYHAMSDDWLAREGRTR